MIFATLIERLDQVTEEGDDNECALCRYYTIYTKHKQTLEAGGLTLQMCLCLY